MDVRDPKALKRRTENGRGAEETVGLGATRRRHEDPLVEKLEALAADLPPEGVTLAEIRDLVGRDGLLFLVLLLSIVFLVPISIPGVSIVFGGGVLLIGLSRLRGRPLWLPKRLADRVLASDGIRKSLEGGIRWLRRLERVSRPRRMVWLVLAGKTEALNDAALMLGGVLLMAPFGLVPFTNTLPGLALVLLSVGLLQRDGLLVLLGHLTNLATLAYFAFLVVGGEELVQKMVRCFTGE